MAAAKKETAVAVQEKNISDSILARVDVLQSEGGLVIPSDYSPGNALKSAWLKLQTTEDKSGKKALEVCTKESIANSLLDMVIQGLSPAKNQCYFIPYGKELTLMRSYMGAVAVAKRMAGVKDVIANVVYQGDEFAYEIDPTTGNRIVTKHVQKLKNININKIDAVYAVVIREGFDNYTEIMTMEQVRKAWGQGATKGGSPAHKNFGEEMAKKTVINRALKVMINSSSDSEILADAYNRTKDNDYRDENGRSYRDKSVLTVEEEDVEVVEDAKAAIFGAGKAEHESNATVEDGGATEDESALTDEEKAEILAAEAAEAEREAENESDEG